MAAGSAVIPAPRPAVPASSPGFYVQHRDHGVTVHLTASEHTVRTVRGLAAAVLMFYGADRDTAYTAQLVLSELLGNAVRAGGDHVPLVVEAYLPAGGATVCVHDPLPELLPCRRGAAMDSALAESGRGLPLLDALAPGWTVTASPIGKQVRCHIA